MSPMLNLIRFICGWIRVTILILRPGGAKAIAAENIVLRQQLIVLSRQHKRSPRLKISDRILFEALASWVNPRRLTKVAIAIKPATLLKLHKALVKRMAQLFDSGSH